jgi:uncharacterized membrane protein
VLQILGYLLCLYLVYKGLEIYQLHLTNMNEETEKSTKLIGELALITAIIFAGVFAAWITFQADATNLQRLLPVR